MSNRKAKPKPMPNRRPVAPAPKPLGYSYERVTTGNPVYGERPAPMLRVPGMRNAKWDRTIGRHVCGNVKSDYRRQIEMDATV